MSYFKKRRGAFGDDMTPPSIDVPMTPEPTTTSTDVTLTAPPSLPPAPASNWVSAGGMCKPTNADFLGKFKELQRQLNRVLEQLGVTKIAVDGVVGSDTMGALTAVGQSTSAGAYGLSNINLASCSTIAAQVDTITARASNLADFLGASSSVSSPAPATTPSYVDTVTGKLVTQNVGASALDSWNNLSTTQKVVFGGIAVGVGALLFGKKGSKKAGRGRRYWGI